MNNWYIIDNGSLIPLEKDTTTTFLCNGGELHKRKFCMQVYYSLFSKENYQGTAPGCMYAVFTGIALVPILDKNGKPICDISRCGQSFYVKQDGTMKQQ